MRTQVSHLTPSARLQVCRPCALSCPTSRVPLLSCLPARGHQLWRLCAGAGGPQQADCPHPPSHVRRPGLGHGAGLPAIADVCRCMLSPDPAPGEAGRHTSTCCPNIWTLQRGSQSTPSKMFSKPSAGRQPESRHLGGGCAYVGRERVGVVHRFKVVFEQLVRSEPKVFGLHPSVGWARP